MRKIYNKLLFVSYHHEIPTLADSVQNHRLLDHLSSMFDIDILYRSQYKRKQNKKGFGVWSLSLSLLDKPLLKLFPFFRPIISIDMFIWSVVAFLKIWMRGGKYDAVVITYEPYSIYILSYLLKKVLKIKVISILYDPLSDNLFFPRSNIGKYFRLQLEKQIIKHSTKIVVNNFLLKNALQQRYQGVDVEMVYLCGNDIHQKNEKNVLLANSPLKIVHCGNIHGMRNLKCINDIIIELKKINGNINQKLKFLFYGNCSSIERVRVTECHNDDVISFIPSIPQSEVPIVLKSADVLLLIDPLEDGNFSFPSKLCEYIQSGKHILAITNRNSPSGHLLNELGYTLCDGSDIKKVVDFIGELILFRNLSDNSRSIDPTVFSPKIISEQYRRIILKSVYAGLEL